MHLLFLLSIVAIAIGLRLFVDEPDGARANLSRWWWRSLLVFALPPLLVLTSCVALVWMGPRHMHVWWQDRLCHGLALSGLAIAVGIAIWNAVQRYRLVRQIRSYPRARIRGQLCRILSVPVPFAAQVGGWQPELSIGQGLLDRLSDEQLEAVLAHEQAHLHYRDTFWFFWLGCLRQWSGWLPNSNRLWQELLTLRELRADAKSLERCDALVLAEALFAVASETTESNSSLWMDASATAFCHAGRGNRLALRIDRLLDSGSQSEPLSKTDGYWLLAVTIPLAVVPLYTCW